LRGFTCAVDVDSESNDLGILGLDATVPAGPLSMRIALRVAADGAGAQELRDVAAWAVDHCPVSDAVRRAIPLEVEVATE
jgi:organic hydroperoxide reductase OsmC/OhrA